MKRNQKGFAHFLILVIVLTVFLAGGWFYTRYITPRSDSPDKYYVANKKTCFLIFYTCPEGYQHFTDNKGCGCELTTENINTSDWKTYINFNYGYSIKYPPSAKIESYEQLPQQEELIEIKINNSTTMIINVSDKQADKDLYLMTKLQTEEAVSEYPQKQDTDFGTFEHKIFDINEMIVYQRSIESESDILFITYGEKDGIIFGFQFTSNNPEIEKNKELYNQILSTFKFTGYQ
jgi:hypothetical protein